MFGLSLYTTERDLRDVFSKYGPLADVTIVYDQQSRRSRGFAFVYFENRDDAKEVKAYNATKAQKRRLFGSLQDFLFIYLFFGFVNHFVCLQAKDRANGMELDGRRIRVDFSITKRPHTPTPGIYMGRPT